MGPKPRELKPGYHLLSDFHAMSYIIRTMLFYSLMQMLLFYIAINLIDELIYYLGQQVLDFAKTQCVHWSSNVHYLLFNCVLQIFTRRIRR